MRRRSITSEEYKNAADRVRRNGMHAWEALDAAAGRYVHSQEAPELLVTAFGAWCFEDCHAEALDLAAELAEKRPTE